MPTIAQIPDAHALHTQLDAVNKAVALLQSGAPVTNLTVTPASDLTIPTMAPPLPAAGAMEAPPVVTPTVYQPPVTIILDPPITDAATIDVLITALQVRAGEITQTLIDNGYSA
jgi:hypothetical protein